MRKIIGCGLACMILGCGGAAFTTEAPPFDDAAKPDEPTIAPDPPEASAPAVDAAPDVARLAVAVDDSAADAGATEAGVDAAHDADARAVCAVGTCQNSCPSGYPRCCTGTDILPGNAYYTDGVCGCDLSSGRGTNCQAQ